MGIPASIITYSIEPGSTFAVGTATVTATATNAVGESSCTFEVTVVDAENPAITCPADITTVVNASGCKATVDYVIAYSDNCSVALNQNTGLASGSDFPLGATVNTFMATDGAGNTASCSFTVTVTTSLTVNAGIDEQTFYGYSGDQTVTHTASASGGDGGYTYAWSLDRPLLCDLVNSAGDESFTAGACVNNTCSGIHVNPPACSGNATVTTTLAADANACVAVTDSKGCTASDCFFIHSEDVRCFNGSLNNNKVIVCHKTGSATNPTVEICVAQPALAAHLSHNVGDYVGRCSRASGKTDETGDNPVIQSSGEFSMNVYPNPTSNMLNVEFKTPAAVAYHLSMYDNLGRKVLSNEGTGVADDNKISLRVDDFLPGIYYLHLNVGGHLSSVKIIVTK